MKSHRQEVVLVIRANKPITKAQAVAMVADNIHGDFYPTVYADTDPGEFKIVTVKARPS